MGLHPLLEHLLLNRSAGFGVLDSAYSSYSGSYAGLRSLSAADLRMSDVTLNWIGTLEGLAALDLSGAPPRGR